MGMSQYASLDFGLCLFDMVQAFSGVPYAVVEFTAQLS